MKLSIRLNKELINLKSPRRKHGLSPYVFGTIMVTREQDYSVIVTTDVNLKRGD